jgi:inorganic pyrophosphatase
MDNLEHIPLRVRGGYNTIIETPRASRTKFAYDKDTKLFLAKKLLPLGFAFPFAFGFLPSTRGGDGDPLDIMLITDADLPIGALVHCRLIGVIQAEQGWRQEEMVRNDRVLGVPLLSHQDRPPFDIADIPDWELDDLEAFFTGYQHADGKIFRPLARLGAAAAERLVNDSIV